MKHIEIPLIDLGKDALLTDISKQLDQMGVHPIDITPWREFSYKPQVLFSIAHGKDGVFLKYRVNEKHVKATYSQPNEPVYKDSCVEFFIAFGDELEYYNFEFNAAGTCLAGFGKQRDNRSMLPASTIHDIRFQSSLKPAEISTADICWELSLAIPLSAFHFHQFTTLAETPCRVNFYKCGDDLPEPHFVVWNNIEAPQPDFHLRNFFGSAIFR